MKLPWALSSMPPAVTRGGVRYMVSEYMHRDAQQGKSSAFKVMQTDLSQTQKGCTDGCIRRQMDTFTLFITKFAIKCPLDEYQLVSKAFGYLIQAAELYSPFVRSL